MISSFTRICGLLLLFYNCLFYHAHAQGSTSILIFGDSIIAGYGLSAEESLSQRMECAFKAKNYNINVINGGVSGDTTTGGRNRIKWSLDNYKPDIVILAIGGNDALRGISPDIVYDNLNVMLHLLKSRDIKIVLSSVSAPANMGELYNNKFNTIYVDLANKYKVNLYPFLLQEIFGNPSFMQADGIHPNAKGVEFIANALTDYLIAEIL